MISIIVPTRNRPEMLAAALASIRRQSYGMLEIVVVDDASTENHRRENVSVISNIDKAIRYFELSPMNGRPQGVSIARNFGVMHSSGDIIGFCDDDDCWLNSEHLAIAAKYFSDNMDIDVIYGNQITASEGEIVARAWQPRFLQNIKKKSRDANGFVRLTKSECLYSSERFPHLNISLYRRRLFDQIGGFSDSLTFYQDLDFFLRAMDRANGVAYLDMDVAIHNRPNRSSTGNLSSELGSVERVLWDVDVTRLLAYRCQDPVVVDYARRLTATYLRDLALLYRQKGENSKASRAARSALAWKFSVRWFVYTCWLGIQWRR